MGLQKSRTPQSDRAHSTSNNSGKLMAMIRKVAVVMPSIYKVPTVGQAPF